MKPSSTIAASMLLLLMGLASEANSQTINLQYSSLTILKAGERARFVTAHNAARRMVGVEEVQWSEELGQLAFHMLEKQKDELIAAAETGWKEAKAVLPEHSTNPQYGENLAGWFESRNRSAELAVELWLGEKAAFDKLNAGSSYRVGDEQGQTERDVLGEQQPLVVGHYTAIVWKTTTEIGAAKLSFDLKDEKGETRTYTAVVCHYNPPGNRIGEKPY